MQIVDLNGEKRDCVEIAPDPTYPGYIKVKYVSRFRANHQYYEWYPANEFIKKNKKLAHFAKNADLSWHEDVGVVSKATKNTLTDKTKNWKNNVFAGYPVWISRGQGEGQLRNILKNTHNTITIDKEWNIIPDKTSQFVISYNIHNPQAMGNTLPQYEVPKGIKAKLIKSSKKLNRKKK